MRSVNKVILIGNVTRDPNSKTIENGQAITTFGVATNRQWQTGNKQKRTSTEFHEVVAWSRLAEICSKMIKKGMPVYIEGYLKTRSWEAENGEQYRKTEIVIQDIIILEKSSHSGSNSRSEALVAPANNQELSEPTNDISEESDIELEEELESDLKEIDIDDDLGL